MLIAFLCATDCISYLILFFLLAKEIVAMLELDLDTPWFLEEGERNVGDQDHVSGMLADKG